MSLLVKDKLLYSFLLCIKILESEDIIDQKIVRFMMVGGTWTESPKPIPNCDFVSKKLWTQVQEMS